MKFFRLVFILMITVSLVLIAADDKDKPKRPKIEQKVVRVPGNQAWTDTGLTLRPQDKVTITASGRVCFGGDITESCVGPDGWEGNYQTDWPGDYAYCFDPLRTANHAALIGGIENNNFFVGRNLTFKDKNGRLYLGINDCSLTGDYYNTGEFSAIVKVEHNAFPKKTK
ncbi:MAG: hypothetical protein PVI11_09330 [Candidatus Aminicenantes bacterium]|jgi:hypothetical protein